MKKLFLPCLVLCCIIIACRNNKNPANKTYKRNTAIIRANACNNLFLDSAALEHFIVSQNMNDNEADRVRTFYYGRNFEFAWFAKDGITEQGRAFWNLDSYNISSLKDSSAFNSALSKRMPDITSEDSLTIGAADTAFVRTELMLTEVFMHYTMKNGGGMNIEQLQQYVPAKKEDVMQAAEKILSSGVEQGLNNNAALAYDQLKNELKKYYAIAKSGGWQSIPLTQKAYKKGVAGPVITRFKKRLQVTGEYTGNDTSETFNDLLDTAVKSLQASLGYTPSGIITDGLVKDMNVRAEKRVQQLVINLNRVRWLPEASPGRFITVNIPEYKLQVYENKRKVFDMNVVVGKETAGTVIFTGNLTEIVFSPYWNVPASIIKKEILPKMEADSNYLANENMEITRYSKGLPVIRQLPGPKNSLGKAKFLFQNSYDIYFHDTPAKDLFSRDKRAYSHGCIRLQDPAKMAGYLLKDNQYWPPEKIMEAMNGAKEKYAALTQSVPVIISYYTAWVDETNKLHFSDDIYRHDDEAARKMFTDPQ
jgi:murein L,D-transpeptidase YcbB/YkuD